jgi:hypothetical protein
VVPQKYSSSAMPLLVLDMMPNSTPSTEKALEYRVLTTEPASILDFLTDKVVGRLYLSVEVEFRAVKKNVCRSGGFC